MGPALEYSERMSFLFAVFFSAGATKRRGYSLVLQKFAGKKKEKKGTLTRSKEVNPTECVSGRGWKD